jgi:membrane fusion protein, multidrug efflux system
MIVGILIVTMILGKIFLFKNEGDSKSKNQEKGPSASIGVKDKNNGNKMSVDIFLAKEKTNNNEIFASGSLIANEEVELRSEASGKITNLYIKEGSSVTKGQLIAKLNDADILVKLKKVKYENELAVQIEARQKKLLDINAISKEEYDIAVNKINTLSTDREALEVALNQTEVRAPFSGRIGLKNISVGAYVNPGTTIATLVQTNPIKMDFSIPEKYSNRIALGRKVSMLIEGDITKKEATIIAIDPKIDVALRTIKIRTSMNNTNGKLMPGMFTKVNVPLGLTKSIMVPTEAIIPFVGGKKIYVSKDGKAKEITIQTGLRTETLVEVTEGLSIGDSVIASGIMNLKNEQNIKVRKVLN